MLEEDLDDTHLCIKCSATIVGLDNYVQHRKTNCGGKTTRPTIVPGYGGFEYPDSSSYAKSDTTGGKTSKALNDPYDLPYELGADVFFSSLQLQSVQASSGGKTGSSGQQILTRKATATLLTSGRDEAEGDWQEEARNNTDNLMKVVRDIGETKKFEPIFKPIAFTHESPEPEQQSDDDDEDFDDDDDDDDDEDYVPTPYSGGKWKPGSQPAPRSGGKWKSRVLTATHKAVTKVSVSKASPEPSSSTNLLSQIRAKLKSNSEYVPKDNTDGLGCLEVLETGGKWKPGFSKLSPSGGKLKLPDSPEVLEAQTDGKWKPGDKCKTSDAQESSEVLEAQTGGKWKPGFAKFSASGGKWKSPDVQESPEVLESQSDGKWKQKLPDAQDLPEEDQTGGKWKPGFGKCSTSGGKYKSQDVQDWDMEWEGKWKPGSSKSSKLLIPPLTGSKWKPSEGHESPEVLEISHTGGKWKPGDGPSSTSGKWKPPVPPPAWDEQEPWIDVDDTHPPVEHTKGKWVPGTKVERLEYKEEVLALPQDFWCNICCRKLKTKIIYEKHLKSSLHMRKSATEQQLERAAVKELVLSQQIFRPPPLLLERTSSPVADRGKRKRRKTFIKCEICKHRMQRYLIGKHLISHYHYVRMALNPEGSFRMILDNIHQVVLQSPFQCSPCRFYANTEENFLNHWNSVEHRDRTEGPGKFWCSFCRFECEDNNQMRRHLLGSDHREVILAINRSVPIYISKKVTIECPKCHQGFRFNMELRQHAARCDGAKLVPIGTASDEYQSRFRCELCPDELLRSKTALQRHEKFKHNKRGYYCSVCGVNFDSAAKAIKHRRTMTHKKNSAKKFINSKRDANIMLVDKISDDLRCEKCGHISSSEVEAMLHQIAHPDCRKEEHKPTVRKSPVLESPVLDSSILESPIVKIEPPEAPLTEPAKEDDPLPDKGSRKCPYCKKSFKTKSKLKLHLNTVHPEAQHICPLCGEAFTLAQELSCHRRYRQCIASTSKQPTDSSKKDSDLKKFWKCSDCTFCSAYESELIFHRIIHTDGLQALETLEKLKCPLCEKSFTKHSLRHHLRQHTNEKMFTCEICKRSFSRRHNYKEHMQYLHAVGGVKKRKRERSTDEKFICDTCGKLFGTKYSLRMHINIHTERDKKFLCLVEGCQYIGRNRAALNMHRNTHMQMDFKCQEKGCIYEGRSSYHLKRHMKNHTQTEKTFKCSECVFQAKNAGHIKRHMRIHTGEVPYKCPHCDYRCGYIENLRKHILTTKKHPGKSIYQCIQCDPLNQYQTNFNSEYLAHLAKVHPEWKVQQKALV